MTIYQILNIILIAVAICFFYVLFNKKNFKGKSQNTTINPTIKKGLTVGDGVKVGCGIFIVLPLIILIILVIIGRLMQ